MQYRQSKASFEFIIFENEAWLSKKYFRLANIVFQEITRILLWECDSYNCIARKYCLFKILLQAHLHTHDITWKDQEKWKHIVEDMSDAKSGIYFFLIKRSFLKDIKGIIRIEEWNHRIFSIFTCLEKRKECKIINKLNLK